MKRFYNFVDNVGFYSMGEERKETHKILVVNGFRESAKSQTRHEMPLTLKSFELPHVLFMWPFASCSSRKPVISNS